MILSLLLLAYASLAEPSNSFSTSSVKSSDHHSVLSKDNAQQYVASIGLDHKYSSGYRADPICAQSPRIDHDQFDSGLALTIFNAADLDLVQTWFIMA